MQSNEDMVSVFGDEAPLHQVVKNWSREFRCGRRECVKNIQSAGRPQTVRTMLIVSVT